MSELPKGWTLAPLGYVVAKGRTDQHLIKGKLSPHPFEGSVPAYSASGQDVWCAEVGNTGPGIVLSAVGARCGKAFLADGRWTAIANTHAFIPEVGMSPRFLWYVMNNEDFWIRGGTAQPFVRVNATLERSIAIPPLAEQERIVAAIEEQFSRLDAGVEALDRSLQNIKRMRDATYEAAVTDWVGEAFSRVRLADVLREPLRNGHSARADPLGTIPILTLSAVTLGNFGSHNIKMTAANPHRVRDLWVQPGDLLIERSNTRELVGTACLYRGRPNIAVYPDLVIRVRVNDRITPEYAELVLKAPRSRRYFQQKAQGISGTMPKIDQQVILELSLALPALAKQTEIVQKAERGLTLLASLQSDLKLAARHSSALRSSILAAAFSGRLVPQEPSDEPAFKLLERIAAERASSRYHQPVSPRNPRASRRRVTA